MAVRTGGTTPAEEPEAIHVIVQKPWFWWRKDEYYNEGPIGVNVNQGILTIEMPNEIFSYAPRAWSRVTSFHLNAPPAPPQQQQAEHHDHEH